MSGLTKTLLVIVALGLLGGAGFLATWDIPAPSNTVERELPNDQFPN